MPRSVDACEGYDIIRHGWLCIFSVHCWKALCQAYFSVTIQVRMKADSSCFLFFVGFQDKESRPGLKSSLEDDDHLYNISICVSRRLLRCHLDPSERLLPHSVPSFLSCRGITQLLSVFKGILRISRRRGARRKMLQHILLSTQILEKMRLSDGLAHIEEQRKKIYMAVRASFLIVWISREGMLPMFAIGTLNPDNLTHSQELGVPII